MEKKIKVWLNILGLVGLTLVAVFIQLTNDKISIYNNDLILNAGVLQHNENIAILNTLRLIYMDTRELTNPREWTSIDQDRTSFMDALKQADSLKDNQITHLNEKISKPPVCIFLKCSTINFWLYLVQIMIILVLIFFNLKEVK